MSVFAFKVLEWITHARTATHFTAFGVIAGAATLEIYASPAGQTSFISDIQSAVTDNAANFGGFMDIRDAGDVVQHRIKHQARGGVQTGGPKTIWQNFQMPLIIPAGWDVAMTTNAAGTDFNLSINGWVD